MTEEKHHALRLVLYQPQAHYRVPFTYQRWHTYPIPTYSAIRGFLCNLLGIRGYTWGCDPEDSEDFQKLKATWISICGRFGAKTTEYTWLRNLSRNQHVGAFGAVENRMRWGLGEHPGGQAPVAIDILNDVRVIVYLMHEDIAFLQYLEGNLKNPVKRLYPLYLGRAEDLVVFESIEPVDLVVTTRSADFEHFFWVPEEPYLPPGVSFDFSRIDGLLYRVPIFWELRDGSRNFHYVFAKLNDGRFREVAFLFDTQFGPKGLPVFFARYGGGKSV